MRKKVEKVEVEVVKQPLIRNKYAGKVAEARYECGACGNVYVEKSGEALRDCTMLCGVDLTPMKVTRRIVDA